MRRTVMARLQRGQRAALAGAAGHQPPWLTNWLRGRQDATIDEIYAVLTALKVPLGKLLDAPDADDLDWEVFGLMARVNGRERKQICRDLVAGLAVGEAAIDVDMPTASSSPRPRRTDRKARKRA